MVVVAYTLSLGVAGMLMRGPSEVVLVGFWYPALPSSLLIFSGFMLFLSFKRPELGVLVMLFTVPFYELSNYALLFFLWVAHGFAPTPGSLFMVWVPGLLLSVWGLRKMGCRMRFTWLFVAYMAITFISLVYSFPLIQGHVVNSWTITQETALEFLLLAFVWRTWRLGA